MRAKRLISLVVTVAVFMLAGCAADPQTPDASAAAARQFLAVWAARDAGAVHGMLTEPAREAVTAETLSRFMRGQEVTY
ncbi:MAG TPA: hypothetical protein VD902_08225, partial [Symbiobacteriaceae bacterium]|nr:hypothetical protein [Symbiobacteriaceae bacterium]